MQAKGMSRGAGMLVFTTVVWGAMFAVAKTALDSIDAFWLTAWRYVPASLTMLVVLWLVEGRSALSTGRATVRLCRSDRSASQDSACWATSVLPARVRSTPQSSLH